MEEDKPVQNPNLQEAPAGQTPAGPVSAKPTPTSNLPGGNKWIWIIGGVVIVVVVMLIYVAIGGLFKQIPKEASPSPVTSPRPAVQETVDTISNEVDALDLGDLEAEFTLIDQDLSTL